MSERAGRRRTAPRCDGTSVSSHRSRATCYPLPAKLCFLIKSIVKERFVRIFLSLSFFLVRLSSPFPSPFPFSSRAPRYEREPIVRSRVSTSDKRGSGPKQGAIQIYSAIPRGISPTLPPFCSSSRRHRGFFFSRRLLDKFQIALGPNDFRVKCRCRLAGCIVRHRRVSLGPD